MLSSCRCLAAVPLPRSRTQRTDHAPRTTHHAPFAAAGAVLQKMSVCHMDGDGKTVKYSMISISAKGWTVSGQHSICRLCCCTTHVLRCNRPGIQPGFATAEIKQVTVLQDLHDAFVHHSEVEFSCASNSRSSTNCERPDTVPTAFAATSIGCVLML